ncbi:MAG: GDP-mannose 4,6-dehydratase [Candidatus Saganbacteria bacterium]|nr:GDP-mannose 4,6-dehydratase [Candidatus Saganbacteria bacterium]
MRVLITGGAGFIGSHLAEKCIKLGEKVFVIDDLSTGDYKNIENLTPNQNFNFVLENILNEAVLDRLVSECDIVFHLAAAVGVTLVMKDPVRTIETNVEGTGLVLKIANRHSKKVIIVSTSEIYGKGMNESFSEEDDRLLGPITRSRWSYACSKSIDEFLALAYYKQNNLPVVICRLFNTIGPRQTGYYGMVVPKFIDQALLGKPLTVFGTGAQTRCFCCVLDVLEAFLLLAKPEAGNGEVFNIGSIEEISIEKLAKKVVEITGSKSEIRYLPYEAAYGEGFEDMQRRKPNINKIQQRFGWQPKYSLAETLKLIINERNPIG